MNTLNDKTHNGTYKGPAMYRLFHQFQEGVLVRDDYVRHFFDVVEIDDIKRRFASLHREPVNEEEKWTRNVYPYAILREKNGDDVVASSIEKGCRQILNLGAGFCTRFFRRDEMREWLTEKGFDNMEVLNQDDLEYRYLNKRTIPDNMFYVVNIYET